MQVPVLHAAGPSPVRVHFTALALQSRPNRSAILQGQGSIANFSSATRSKFALIAMPEEKGRFSPICKLQLFMWTVDAVGTARAAPAGNGEPA